MIMNLIALFLISHGLVHLWYVVLSGNLIDFQSNMGWTGESWLLSGLMDQSTVNFLAMILFSAAAVAFIIAGLIFMTDSHLWRVSIVSSAVFSSIVLLLFWDGSTNMILQKGLIGLILNIIIIVIAMRK